MTKVTVVEIQGCMASSAAITHDVMATANQISGAAKRALPFNVTMVRCGPRRSSCKLRDTDLIIVPGLGTASEDELDAKLKSPACRRLRDMLVEAFESGAMLAASCASTFLLADTGLLDGRRATTTWWLAQLFRRRYPKVELVTDQIVVADWPIATGGAAMAQMDLMLAIVGRFAGPSLAKACANYLLLDERHSQAPFMAIAYLASQDPRIVKAERWVRDNIARDFTIDELAEVRRLGAAYLRTADRSDLRRLPDSVRSAHKDRDREISAGDHTPVCRGNRPTGGYAEPSTLRRLIRRDTRHSPRHFRRSAYRPVRDRIC